MVTKCYRCSFCNWFSSHRRCQKRVPSRIFRQLAKNNKNSRNRKKETFALHIRFTKKLRKNWLRWTIRYASLCRNTRDMAFCWKAVSRTWSSVHYGRINYTRDKIKVRGKGSPHFLYLKSCSGARKLLDGGQNVWCHLMMKVTGTASKKLTIKTWNKARNFLFKNDYMFRLNLALKLNRVRNI